MGADVIKIERPGRLDGTRKTDRLFAPGMSSYFLGLNRSKRAIVIDYGIPEGRDVIYEMVKQSDVVIENFRPGAMAAWGLDYETLFALNPALIYCDVTAFGKSGPLSKKPGMDLIVQAMGGLMGLTGEPNGRPLRVGSPIGDFVGAYQASLGILLALFERTKSAKGQQVSVSLLDGQVSLLANYIPGFFETGKPSGPVGVSHPQIVPYQLFECADGYLVVACLTEIFWESLCEILNRSDLLSDPRFTLNADRVENRAVLVPILETIFKEYRVVALASLLENADVPCAPVHSLADLTTHAQVAHNEMLPELTQKNTGPYRVVGIPIKLSRTPGAIRRSAPEVGEHTDEVLLELGISAPKGTL